MPRIALVMAFVIATALRQQSPAPSTSQATPAPVASAAPATDRPYLLERVDEAAVVQLYADGFTDLPLKEKTLIWHLYQAAIAGRDIFYDQRYAHNLEMRDVLEAIVSHPTGVDPTTLGEIQRYTKLFWINTGPFNNLTARKFVLTCTPEAFAAAAHAAEKAGATFPLQKNETLDQLLTRLRPQFFDPNVDPMVTAKTPPTGQGHPDCQRQQPVRRRHDEGPRRIPRAAPAQLAPGETRRHARRGGLQGRRTLQQTDRGDRRVISRPRFRLPRRRWPTRSGR